MDLHDGLGDGAEQGMWEPPGFDAEPAATATDEETADPRGYDGSGGYDDTGIDPGDSAAGATMIVEVDGETRELPAEQDYTGDGQPDAVAETADGRVIVFADTEDNGTGAAGPDGRADEAYVVDKQTGRVVGAAHIDPASGQWVEGLDAEGPTAAVSGSGGSGGEPAPAPGPGSDDEPAGGSGGPEVVTVEVGGHEIGVAATLDTDGDGEADSGVIYADGRAVVLTSTDDDPGAEQAAVVDPQTGRVVEVSHVDPETGEREEGPAPGTGGTTDAGASGGPGAPGDPGDPGGTPGGTPGGSGGPGGAGTMTVDLGGETRELPAERDYTGDGRPDAAAETSDGRVIVFADTEDNETGAAGPDGRADEAYVVDKQTGRVVGAAHVDPRTGEWVERADTDGSPAVPSSTGGEVDS